MSADPALADERRATALAAAAWAFRWRVELEAEARFARLAAALERSGVAAPLTELAWRASRDERRHAERCAAVAAGLGLAVGCPPPPPPAVAPARLPPAQALAYEVVAACCVAETLSVAALTTLLSEVRAPSLRGVLRELAADEVCHARLGWAYLASRGGMDARASLGPLLPDMLRGSVDEALFEPAAPGGDDLALPELGVLRHEERRELFQRTLETVVLPGLDSAGVDTGAGRAWLARATLEGPAWARSCLGPAAWAGSRSAPEAAALID